MRRGLMGRIGVRVAGPAMVLMVLALGAITFTQYLEVRARSEATLESYAVVLSRLVLGGLRDFMQDNDREAIGRVIKYGGDKPRLYFNYQTKLNDVWASAELQEKYGYQAVFPERRKEGLIIRL